MAVGLLSGLSSFLAMLLIAGSASASTFAVQGTNGLYANVSGSWSLLYEGQIDGFGVSPDGEYVAYSPFLGENGGDVLVENVNTNAVEILSNPDIGWGEGVRFTPGGQIVGSGYSESLGGYGIFLMNADGSGLRRLVSGHATWPVVSSKGALAYLADGFAGQDNLYILDPTPSGKTVPRLLATKESYGATAGRPSFNPNGEQILFPRASANFIVDVSSGVVTEPAAAIGNRPEWEESNTVLSLEPNKINRTFLSSNSSVTAGSIPSGSNSWVRAEPPEAEVTPPQAIVLDGLLDEFAPELRYDSQEPYFADAASELTDGYGLDESGILYTPLLYNEANEVLADPFLSEPEYAEEHGHAPSGKFPLWLDALGDYYHAGFEYPDPEGVASEDDWVDEHNGTHMADASRMHEEGYGDYAYGRVVKQGSDIWLQYWLWYYYNNGQAGFGDHEGDWELVQVHLDNAWVPDEVVFAAHSHAARCTTGEFELSATSGGPVVYVGNGSHASYPEEGEYLTELFPFVDTAFPDLEEVPAVIPTVIDLAQEEFSWLEWPGRWGGSASSPRGPKQGEHAEQWSDPASWAEGAEECLDRKVGPPARQAAVRSTWADSGKVGSTDPLELVDAELVDGEARIRYRAAALRKPREGWPKLMVSFDSIADSRPPRTIIIDDVGRQGTVVSPFELSPRKRWRVRASLFGPRVRSRVVATPLRS